MIEVRELFPTCISIDENLMLAKALLPLCDKYTALSTSNCLAIENFPSTLYEKELTDQIMAEPLVQEAFHWIINYPLARLLGHRSIDFPGKHRPFGFFSSMNKGAYLHKHQHLDCYFSGLLYLDVGDDVPDIIIHDPRPVEKFISYPRSVATRTNSGAHVIKPKPGMILLWDAWLEHETPQKLNDNPRKTFVFNI
jgi:hypothetical protein